MKRFLSVITCFLLAFQLNAQDRTGTIKVRKTKIVKGLYVLEEGQYYKVKLYLRLFDDNAAVFLKGPLTPKEAKDSTSRILYDNRKGPAVYRVVNDSLLIEGTENQAPVMYRGIVKDNRLRLRKYHRSKETTQVFKKLM